MRGRFSEVQAAALGRFGDFWAKDLLAGRFLADLGRWEAIFEGAGRPAAREIWL